MGTMAFLLLAPTGTSTSAPSADITLIGVAFLCDFVDLINKDNTVFRALNIIVRCCKQFADNPLDVITDIPCLCQGRRICDGKRHI